MALVFRSITGLVSAVCLLCIQPASVLAGSRAYDINILLNQPHPFASAQPVTTRAPPIQSADTDTTKRYGELPWKTSVTAGDTSPTQKSQSTPDDDDWLTRKQKVAVLNTAAVVGVAAYGVVKWNYFQTSPKASTEGWFGRTTKSGGADKLGHLWTTYATSHLLADIYNDWGYSEARANTMGALSALGIQTMMELGDSFSEDYGFSYEDMVMNVAGAGAAYILGRYPILKSKIDLRMGYDPDSASDFTGDIFTDYERQNYLLVLKLDGFEMFEESYLGYLEFHMGYFTRGYEEYRVGHPDGRRRSLFFGVGFNVTKLIKKFAKFSLFNYVQLPYVSTQYDVSLD